MDVAHPARARAFSRFVAPTKSGNYTANVQFVGLDWIVNYDYQRAEQQTYLYPGCDAQIELCEIHISGHPPHEDLTDYLSLETLAAIKQKLVEQLGDY